MYSDHFKDGKSPFLEEIDTSLFFTGGNRGNVYEEIQTAISQGTAVITLTGDEGSGKSHLCQKVSAEISEGVFPVYLPETLESFEDVIRVVAQELQISLHEQQELTGVQSLLQRVLELLDERQQRLLILFDQAEQIYLATLERIRKVLDQVNGERIRFQILLSGRKTLQENLQLLTVCSFEGTEEKDLVLELLSSSETYEYLNFCMQGQESEKEVFSREATEKIYSMAQGSLKMTNILAEESLQSLSGDTSFLVLLENVRGSEDELNQERAGDVVVAKVKEFMIPVFASMQKLLSSLFALIKRNMPSSISDLFEHKEWIIGGASGLVVIFLLFFMLFGGEEEPENRVVQVEDNVKVEFKEIEITSTSKEQTQQGDDKREKKVASKSKELPQKKEPQVEQIVAPIEKSSGMPVVDKPVKQMVVKQEEPVLKEIYKEDVIASSPPASIDPPSVKEVELVQTDPPAQHLTTENTQKKVIVEDKEKENSATIRLEPLAAVGNSTTIPVLGGKEIAKKRIKAVPQIESVDKIYARRVVASAKWWVLEQGDSFTVQLMVLRSDSAERNLKKMLAQKKYKKIANNLYILRRKASPLTILVFYGEYKSLDEAREASKNLPDFLRNHQPYAISIAEAVKKAGAG